ncbi:hypothetical protein E2P81_ATG07958 [Venturia nashicola]|nr:hypothetical protein E2P81_ATG07958 [Venturia nashicola]
MANQYAQDIARQYRDAANTLHIPYWDWASNAAMPDATTQLTITCTKWAWGSTGGNRTRNSVVRWSHRKGVGRPGRRRESVGDVMGQGRATHYVWNSKRGEPGSGLQRITHYSLISKHGIHLAALYLPINKNSVGYSQPSHALHTYSQPSHALTAYPRHCCIHLDVFELVITDSLWQTRRADAILRCCKSLRDDQPARALRVISQVIKRRSAKSLRDDQPSSREMRGDCASVPVCQNSQRGNGRDEWRDLDRWIVIPFVWSSSSGGTWDDTSRQRSGVAAVDALGMTRPAEVWSSSSRRTWDDTSGRGRVAHWDQLVKLGNKSHDS